VPVGLGEMCFEHFCGPCAHPRGKLEPAQCFDQSH
jgi:hypothetical protein